MRDRIKEIPTQFTEFWKKYTGKQKTIIIAVICVILVAIAFVAWFVSRPKWTQFQRFENLDDANAMASALTGAEIEYDASKDGLTLYVHDKDMTQALYAMSDNKLTDTGYTWDSAFDNSISTTESEKSQKRILALQSSIKKSLQGYSFIDNADVFIDVPETTYSVLDEEGKTSITALIEVSDNNKDMLTTETAEALASWLANAVGTDTEHVIINDSNATCIYNGATKGGLGGALSGGVSEFCDRLRNTIASNVTDLLVKTGYDDIQVGTSGISFDTSTVEELSKTYSVAEGREYGYPTDLYTYSGSGLNGSGGIPGTSSNDDDTDTMLKNTNGSSSSVEVQDLDKLLTDETIRNIKSETPAIKLEDSSLAVVALRYVIHDEEVLEKDGTLDDMTFEEYMAQNDERTQVQATEQEIALISAATGVAQNNISVIAYEVPKFVEKAETGRGIADYLMIILAVLIIALLIYVVLRGTAPVGVDDEEPELSVEQLLATTKENQSLDDIEFSDKSETRKMIEKFVEENPEAVAQLLRNWLNDDWN